MLNEDT